MIDLAKPKSRAPGVITIFLTWLLSYDPIENENLVSSQLVTLMSSKLEPPMVMILVSGYLVLTGDN